MTDTIAIRPPVHDALSAWGIALIAMCVAALFVSLLARGGPRRRAVGLTTAAAAVMLFSAWVADRGALQRFDSFPPPMLVMVLAVFAMGFALGFSPVGREAARTLPLASLVGLQAFRLPLEVVMHHAGNRGIMPEELSYSGYNFDIVTGASALALWASMRGGAAVPRAAVWAWNLWGCWCLAVIAFVAVATSPMVRLFGDDPAHVNTWVLFFPYVWLPVVLVTVAVAGHVIITRALLYRERTGVSPVAVTPEPRPALRGSSRR